MMRSLFKPANRFFVWGASIIGIIVSIFLSIWSITIDDVINNDGIVYVRAAEFLSSGDWQAAITVYKWPFYPWLMMLVGDNVGISYKTAGHVLNTIFFSFVVVFFIHTVRSFGGRSRLITLMALFIALAHPAFNEYRAFLIRDPGYLAAYLLAVYYFARYRWQPRGRYSSAAIASLVVASLFRIEGLVFLFAMPVLLLISHSRLTKWRWPRYLVSLLLVLILGAVYGGYLLAPIDGSTALLIAEEPIRVFGEGWGQIRAGVTGKLSVLQQEFLGPFSADYAYLLFALTVLTVFALSIVAELAIPYTALIGYGLFRRALFNDQQLQRLWLGLILINGIVLVAFALIMLFLAPRYPLAMVITLLITAPFILERLIKDIQKSEIRKLGSAFLIICFLWGIGESYSGVTNFGRNFHLRDAGYWLHTKTVNTSGPILTNNRRIAYYTSVLGNREVLTMSGQALLEFSDFVDELGSDYAGIRIQRSDDLLEFELNKAMKSAPVKIFDNNHGDRVLLYDLR